jgi:predicted DNA-binding transcriptional regulator AlpA
MSNPTPVGQSEIAGMAGVSQRTVDQWTRRHDDFPAPRWTVGGRPTWDAADVARWLAATGRTASVPVACVAVHCQGYTGTVRDLIVLIGPADRAADLQRLGERLASQNGRAGPISYGRASELAQNNPYNLYGIGDVTEPADLDWLGLPGPAHEHISQSRAYIPRRVERCEAATAAALTELDAEQG